MGLGTLNWLPLAIGAKGFRALLLLLPGIVVPDPGLDNLLFRSLGRPSLKAQIVGLGALGAIAVGLGWAAIAGRLSPRLRVAAAAAGAMLYGVMVWLAYSLPS
jgi:hypothetical protein